MHVELLRVATRDGLRLEGALHAAAEAPSLGVDAWLLLHGTGSNFYSSTLLEAVATRLASLGGAVLCANTRGHDLLNVTGGSGGARRLGAACELVADCLHDVAAWLDLLAARGYQRLGLAGHSLGAVKAIYAQALAPQPAVTRLLAISPARLSYAHFAAGPQADLFRKTLAEAEEHIRQERGETLLNVEFPLPYVVTAAGYLDKYGPAEKYNVLQHIAAVQCPALAVFGSLEVQTNTAFAGLPEELADIAAAGQPLRVAIVPGGDHMYTAVRSELLAHIERWLRRQPV